MNGPICFGGKLTTAIDLPADEFADVIEVRDLRARLPAPDVRAEIDE